MSFDLFVELATELKIQIIKKVNSHRESPSKDGLQCYPVPYVRLRQACRHVDELCEADRKQLRVYCYGDNPQLHLINSLSGNPFNENLPVG